MTIDIDELTGEVFDAVHNNPAGIIETEGHTTLDIIENETPYLKERWQEIRAALLALPPETINHLVAARETPDFEALAKSLILRG